MRYIDAIWWADSMASCGWGLEIFLAKMQTAYRQDIEMQLPQGYKGTTTAPYSLVVPIINSGCQEGGCSKVSNVGSRLHFLYFNMCSQAFCMGNPQQQFLLGYTQH
jgi:hypothetical protein